MIEVFGKMLSILGLAFTIFIVTPVLISLGMDFYCCTRISNAGREFIDSARAQGRITEENLNELYREVYLYGGMEITIDYEQLISYPDKDNEGSLDEYVAMSNNRALDKIYEEHELIMAHGDRVHLSIKQRTPGMAARMIEYFTAQRIFPVLNDYGGIVF